MFVEELIKRSRNAPLNVVVNKLNFSDVHALTTLRSLSMAGCRRVRTLYLDLYWNPLPEDSSLSDLISSFPLLEKIFFDSPFPADVNFLANYIQVQVKVMQIGIKHLGNLAIPGHFPELTWLSLNYEMNTISLPSVLKALHNLPNLQLLRLFWVSWGGIPMASEITENFNPMPILTLPKLTVLISNSPVLHLIYAPKLLYLDITPQHAYPIHSPNNDTYCCLRGFDFSRITHIWCHMGIIHGSSPPYTTWGPTYRWHQSPNAYQFLPSKYYKNNSLEWIFDDLPASELDYPNAFYLLSGAKSLWQQPPDMVAILILCIEKATNLVEIVLDDYYPHFWNQTEIGSFPTALRGATTVRNLIVLSTISLQTLCDLLSDGDLVPNLERLKYTAIYHEDDGFSFYSFQKLKERSGTRTRGLQIELKGFRGIQSQDLEEIESFGVLRQEEVAGGCFDFFISIIGSSIGE